MGLKANKYGLSLIVLDLYITIFTINILTTMATPLLYIGPGLGVGAGILIVLVLLLIVASFGYLLWYRIKRATRKK